MKKFVAMALLLLMAGGAAKAESKIPLYEVRSYSASGVVYIFPTIHMADERAYPLPRAALDAFESSEGLYVEMDIGAATAANAASLALKSGDKVWNGFISLQLFERARSFLTQRGAYLSIYEKCHPFALMSAIEAARGDDCGLDAELGFDRYFLDRARETGKRIVEIEGAARQLEIMISDIPGDAWESLIEGSLETEQSDELTRVYDALLAGDQAALSETASEGSEAVSEILINRRNSEMARVAAECVNSGSSAFIAIGSAHVFGERGIIAELQRQGFAVRRLN